MTNILTISYISLNVFSVVSKEKAAFFVCFSNRQINEGFENANSITFWNMYVNMVVVGCSDNRTNESGWWLVAGGRRCWLHCCTSTEQTDRRTDRQNGLY